MNLQLQGFLEALGRTGLVQPCESLHGFSLAGGRAGPLSSKGLVYTANWLTLLSQVSSGHLKGTLPLLLCLILIVLPGVPE